MARSGVKFGRKTEDAIAALLSQRNVDEAARTAGIGTRTLLRWMKDPEFDAAFRAARRPAFGQTDGPAPPGLFRRYEPYEFDRDGDDAGNNSVPIRGNQRQS